MFDVCTTYHTTLQASPMQIVFGLDAILNIKNVDDWEKSDNTNNYELIIIKNKTICTGITTNTRLVKKF